MLRHLVASDYETPVDTFQDLLDRKLVFLVPRGVAVPYLLRTSPRKTLRRVFREALEGRGGYYDSLQKSDRVKQMERDGRGASISTRNLIVGSRHFLRLGSDPIARLPIGYFYTLNADFRDEADRVLHRINGAGIYAHLERRALWSMARPERDHARKQGNGDDGKEPVTLTTRHVLPILLVLAGGLPFAVSTFCMEMIVRKDKRL